MPLNDHEIETYRRDGLVIPSNYRLAPEVLARIDELYSNRALFLLRGEDRSGRNNFSLGHE